MAVVGAVIGAVGALAQGAAAAEEARYQAQVARNNAVIARRNAEYSLEAGVREESAYRIKGTLLRSAIKARYGASGVDVNIGSPVRVDASAALVQELDALTLRNNAAREAYNHEVQATNFESQAELNEMQASNAMMSGFFGAASSLASGIGSVSGKWAGWRSSTPYTPVTYPGPTLTSPPMAVPLPGLSSPTVPRANYSTVGAPIPGTLGI